MVWQTYAKVKANKGGAGIDDMDWAYLEKHQYNLIYKLWNRLTSDSYFPQLVKQASSNSISYGFAIDLDIKGFFDNIDHELMMKAVKHYCPDKWVLMYVERWLKAGVLRKDGTIAQTLKGTPQGSLCDTMHKEG